MYADSSIPGSVVLGDPTISWFPERSRSAPNSVPNPAMSGFSIVVTNRNGAAWHEEETIYTMNAVHNIPSRWCLVQCAANDCIPRLIFMTQLRNPDFHHRRAVLGWPSRLPLSTLADVHCRSIMLIGRTSDMQFIQSCLPAKKWGFLTSHVPLLGFFTKA